MSGNFLIINLYPPKWTSFGMCSKEFICIKNWAIFVGRNWPKFEVRKIDAWAINQIFLVQCELNQPKNYQNHDKFVRRNYLQNYFKTGKTLFSKKKGSFMKICLLLEHYIFALIRDLFCKNQWSKTSKISPKTNFFALLGSLFTWSMPFTYKKCINYKIPSHIWWFYLQATTYKFLRAIQILLCPNTLKVFFFFFAF